MTSENNKIEMLDEEGNHLEFEHLLTFAVEEQLYIAFTPYVVTEGFDPGEVLIMRIKENEDQGDSYIPIETEVELSRLWDIFQHLYYEDGKKDKGNAQDTQLNYDSKVRCELKASDAEKYFEPDDELFYLHEEVLQDPTNLRLRVKLVYNLFERIKYFENIETYDDLIKTLQLSENNLEYLVNAKPNKADKKMIFLKIISQSMLGNTYLIMGKLDEAIINWYKSLELISNNNFEAFFVFDQIIIGNLVSNILCALSFFELKEHCDYLLNKYRINIDNNFDFSIKVEKDMISKYSLENKIEFLNMAKDRLVQLDEAKNLDKFLFVKLMELPEENIDEIYQIDDDGYASFNCGTNFFINLIDDLANGKFEPVFRKKVEVRQRQKRRIRAYLPK